MSCISFSMFFFSLRKRNPQNLKLNQNKKTPKLSISFIERKEMRPNSPFAGNSTVFNEVGCGTDGAHHDNLSVQLKERLESSMSEGGMVFLFYFYF